MNSVRTEFLRALAVCYFIGFLFHFADILNLRLNFSSLSGEWKAWIVFLLLGDLVAAVGLYLRRWWGAAAFVLIALSQIAAYSGILQPWGSENFLVGFHVSTLCLYVLIKGWK